MYRHINLVAYASLVTMTDYLKARGCLDTGILRLVWNVRRCGHTHKPPKYLLSHALFL